MRCRLQQRTSPPSRSKILPHVEHLETREVLSGVNQQLVSEAYEDLLNRTVDPTGLAHWQGLLDNGAQPVEVVRGIVGSPEYRTRAVQTLYKALLSRDADAPGLNTHLAKLNAGATTEAVTADFLGSAEYFQKRGLSNTQDYLESLYTDCLGRPIDDVGAAGCAALLAGGASRADVARLLLTSAEGEGHRVREIYRQYLFREADASGLRFWVGQLDGGARTESVVAGVVGSAEYVRLVGRVDAVVDWNEVALTAIRADRTAPPRAARNLAMVGAAVYDAVNAITKTHQVYKITATAPAGASADAAAVVAAHCVLSGLYPAQAALFDAELGLSLDLIPDGTAKIDGILVGRTVADGILALRANDGAGATVPYTVGADAGDWQPTPPAFAQPPALPQWPGVTPFAMTSGSQFRPAAPPALSSAEYAAALNEVQSLGKKDSATRTADQTQIALFWADGAGTVTPPGHWNVIAQHQALLRGGTLAENARLFALLNVATADAGINAWDAKYQFDLWRPVTAIRQADRDGNAATTADATWEPLLTTPAFPTYTSGHSTFSAAAAAVLANVFGADVAFTDRSDDLPGVYRTFSSFAQAADEAGRSRIFGGIHFEFDNSAALAAGRALAAHVLQNFLKPV